ncbi:hypothetical protein FA10DRAFT_301611 [Acaromyces ingoldii]|uniref:Uncharacterized protein n=1 Tax=Acaromyces ingoldii TaxID=215250 RepID=A0A316YLU3_9BASI|nr:hypothetical protein FA10DRAFT_301611 [Acaromyces ingoldii]PWN90347.1 hypothetical protein FA10DRAFT_301611 [Acaromyces ingoldii]
METMRFDVETATESISDLRLQVVEVGAGDSQQQEAKGPRRPRWFRERTLTPQDEIVDRLVDANTAHVTWTTHRPVRGWYLHLRSPLLPPGSAIPLRPSRTAAADPSSTPLTFTIGTSIDLRALKHVRTFIESDRMPSSSGALQPPQRTSHEPRVSGAFTTVALDQPQEAVTSSTKAQERASSPKHEHTDTPAARSTAREIHVEGSSGRGSSHARRRSAGISISGSGPASGSASGSRHVSRSSQLDGIAPPTIVVEEEEEGDEEKKDKEGHGGVRHPLEDADQPYHKPPSPHALGSRGSSQASKTRKNLSPSGRSPVRSSRVPGSSPSPSPSPSSTSSTPSPSPSMSSPRSRKERPRACNFLLTDGSGASNASWLVESQMAPGRVAEGGHRLGWARWAWSLMPQPIRPPLAIDTSKTFSLRWLDPPPMHERMHGREGGPGTGSGQGAEASGPGIEVLRFEDRSGWWFWKAKQKGRLTIQAHAVQCLGIDLGFWIALALAYLEQLEERDGYNAAADG